MALIDYKPLWKTMDAKGITTYALINKHGVSSRTVNNLKHNKSITLYTMEKLCEILNCQPNDIVKFTKE